MWQCSPWFIQKYYRVVKVKYTEYIYLINYCLKTDRGSTEWRSELEILRQNSGVSHTSSRQIILSTRPIKLHASFCIYLLSWLLPWHHVHVLLYKMLTALTLLPREGNVAQWVQHLTMKALCMRHGFEPRWSCVGFSEKISPPRSMWNGDHVNGGIIEVRNESMWLSHRATHRWLRIGHLDPSRAYDIS